MVQSIEAKPLEPIRFDRVEQLAAQGEEVAKEVAKVQQMVNIFWDKVHPTAQPEPTTTT